MGQSQIKIWVATVEGVHSTSPLRRILRNALIQPLRDYAWSKICTREFLQPNWQNIHDRYPQFIVSDIFRF